MFGIDSMELLIVAVLALLFIGPKDLPGVMLKLGRMIGKVRGYARHFTSGVEQVMRQAELDEMDRQWREQNQAILAQYPADAAYPEPDNRHVMRGDVPPTDAAAQILDDEPTLPFEAPAAPDDDPRPPAMRELP